MKDPENGEEMKGGTPEGEEPGEKIEEEPGEELKEEPGEEGAKETAEDSGEAGGGETTEEETTEEEATEEEATEEIEAPGKSGTDKLSRPLIAGGIAVLVLSWVAIIVLAFLLVADDGGGSTDGIDEVVQGYFQAIEENRQMDVYALYDPDDLAAMAESYGMTVEDFLSYVEQGAAETSMEVDFEGITYDVSLEDAAVAKITGGAYTMLDEEGNPTTEEMGSVDNPVEIELVKKDGQWYLKMPSQ